MFTIFIDDADLLSIVVPTHIDDDALIAIVDHLLVPRRLVQHPNGDETVVVACRQLLEPRVPRHDLRNRMRAFESVIVWIVDTEYCEYGGINLFFIKIVHFLSSKNIF